MIGLFIFIVIVLIGAILVWLLRASWNQIRRDHRRLEWLSSRQYVLLMIEVPRHNDKTPLAAEQMFASLHGIAQASSEFQEHISFEIVAQGSNIRFFVFCATHLRDFVEGQIYAQYPSVEIVKVDDYARAVDLSREHLVGTELEMTKADVYPIKTFANFTVDPLAGITAPLAKLEDSEQVWIQVLVRPVDDTWQSRGTKYIEHTRAGHSMTHRPSILGGVVGSIGTLATDTIREAASPGSIKIDATAASETKLSGAIESGLKGIEEKITKLGFATKIRIVATALDMYSAQGKVMSVVGAFKQFNTTNLNGFTAKQMTADSRLLLDQYVARSFEDAGLVLNIEELASLYHLPNITVETPNIAWTRSKKGEPPGNLPIVGQVAPAELTRIGKTNFRNSEKEFGIKLGDRRRHTYVIGKSGTGKSTLLENMILDDISEGRGVILVDPHGETYEHVLAAVPQHRINDCILFDPADRMNPIGFNLLEAVNEDLKGIVASGFVGIFEKMFSNSWGPRLEHILRNTVLALLDYPDATMLGIPKMLTDKKFRQGVVDVVKDSVIRDFWENEFASWDQKFAAEAVAPILNKVGQFISAATIRNIVGQSKSTFDVREVMDHGKILLINLSRGRIGEDNSAMLGAMMITKIQLAAMSRADIPEERRVDSYLYVDEFQNFATRSFATILSEARKYRLNLIMTNQYIAQIPEEVRDAVFGNVGTIVAFRVGAADASVLVQEFTPDFLETDMVNQDIHKIYIKMSIDGLTGQAFSADTLKPVRPDTNYSQEILDVSRELYSRPRGEVEAEIGSFSLIDKPIRSGAPTDGTIALPSIKINPEHVLNGLYYKELHATGGAKWWEGEPLENVFADEEKKRQKFIAKRVEQLKSGTLGQAIEEDKGEEKLLPPSPESAEKLLPAPTHLVGAPIASIGAAAPFADEKRLAGPSGAGESGASRSVESPQNRAPHQSVQGRGIESTVDHYSVVEQGREPNEKDMPIDSVAPLLPAERDYEGWLPSVDKQTEHPSDSKKRFVQEGSQPGEGLDSGNSVMHSSTTELPSDQANNENPLPNQQKNAVSTDLAFLHQFQSEPAHGDQKPQTGYLNDKSMSTQAHKPPEQAQKAPESPRSLDNHTDAPNAHPHSILQHFIKQGGDKNNAVSAEGHHDKGATGSSAANTSHAHIEPDEDVPYVFS